MSIFYFSGVRSNDLEVFIPTWLFYLFATSNLFPMKVKLAMYDFFGCGVQAHEN